MYTIGWENADLIIGESMKIDYTDVLAWLSQLAWKARRKADMAVEMIVTPYSMNDWHIKFKAVCDMIIFLIWSLLWMILGLLYIYYINGIPKRPG